MLDRLTKALLAAIALGIWLHFFYEATIQRGLLIEQSNETIQALDRVESAVRDLAKRP